jgi:hypothetical protein
MTNTAVAASEIDTDAATVAAHTLVSGHSRQCIEHSVFSYLENAFVSDCLVTLQDTAEQAADEVARKGCDCAADR